MKVFLIQNLAKKKVAILFTDIVGFTKLSEKHGTQSGIELLSKYQTKMVDAIFANGGTVDKFIGDSVMATFEHLYLEEMMLRML